MQSICLPQTSCANEDLPPANTLSIMSSIPSPIQPHTFSKPEDRTGLAVLRNKMTPSTSEPSMLSPSSAHSILSSPIVLLEQLSGDIGKLGKVLNQLVESSILVESADIRCLGMATHNFGDKDTALKLQTKFLLKSGLLLKKKRN